MQTTNARRTLDQAVGRALRARAGARWDPWRWHDLPNGPPNCQGWAKEFRRVAENGAFVVMLRPVQTPWGEVTHAMVSAPVGGKPTWAEMQRMKDELIGRERIAVQVFPRHADIVDAADASHFWVLPAGMALPFGLHRGPTQ